MPQQLPAAVLFDMDGTLVDSEAYWMAAEYRLVERDGGTWTHEDAIDLIGSDLTRAAQILRARGGVKGTDAEIVDGLLDHVIEQANANGLIWRPGALDLLAAITAAGIPSALVTMSYERFARTVVEQAPAGALQVLVTGDSVTNGKPHPEPYLKAAELLGVDIADCVAVEDSPPGIASAEAAGARVIAVKMYASFEAAPGRSRLASLEQIGLDDVAAIHNGKVIDLLD